MNKGKRVATLRDLAFDLFRRDTGDKAALARQCEDLSIEIHDLGNRLHKAGLHRQGTAADVAAGMIEELMEGLKNGHARLVPRLHAFRYPSWFLMLAMRRLRTHPTLPGVAINRRGIVSFHDLDHGDGQGDALGWVERLLHSQGVHADGEIWLQTFPRLWGWVFKPVSFWYAHGADGHLRAVVAEVNNTFGERHAYVLHADDPTDRLPWGAPLQARKVLHVSPFCQPSGRYRFRFMRTARTAEPGERLLARVDHDDESGQPLLRTSWSGNLQPLTHRALW